MTAANTFNEIKKLLKADKQVACNQATLSILELDKKASLKKIDLNSVGANAFLIKYDEGGFPEQTLFAPHPSLHRACDAIVFCEVDGKPYILCIELKSSEPKNNEVAEQFRNAHCFLDYLDAVLDSYCHCDPIKNWPRRYFVFHNQKNTPMRKTALGAHASAADNLTPDTATFIPVYSGQSFYLRQLLGAPV